MCIRDRVITGDRPRDLIGGSSLCAKPFFNTPLSISILDESRTWSNDDIDDLKDAQCCVLNNNDALNSVITNVVYTSYATDTAGNTDPTYKYQEFVDTTRVANQFFYTNLKVQYGQVRLVNGKAIEGQVDAGKVRTSMDSLFDILSGPDYLCLDKYKKKDFMDKLVITTNKANRGILVTGILPIVSQLENITGILQVELK